MGSVIEPTQIAESVCPAGPDGVHYFFSDDECAYCHKLDQIADYERVASEAIRALAEQYAAEWGYPNQPQFKGQTYPSPFVAWLDILDREVRRALQAEVERCREEGVIWHDIGQVTGTNKGGAYCKFGRPDLGERSRAHVDGSLDA